MATTIFTAYPLPSQPQLTTSLSITISGLSTSATLLDIKTSFSKFGKITHVSLKVDNQGQSKGICNLSFTTQQSISNSIAFYHNRIVDGNLVTVQRTTLIIPKTIIPTTNNAPTFTSRSLLSELNELSSVRSLDFKLEPSQLKRTSNQNNLVNRLHPNSTLSNSFIRPLKKQPESQIDLVMQRRLHSNGDAKSKILQRLRDREDENDDMQFDQKKNKKSAPERFGGGGGGGGGGGKVDQSEKSVFNRLGKKSVAQRLGSKDALGDRLGKKKESVENRLGSR